MKTVFVKDVNKLTSGESITLMGWAQEIRVMKNIGMKLLDMDKSKIPLILAILVILILVVSMLPESC